MLAMQNVETMNGYGVKKIVTNCPHAFNTLKHEYPDFGGDYEVVHGTQLIADLVRSRTHQAHRVGGDGRGLPRSLLPGPDQRRIRGAAFPDADDPGAHHA
jgi:hypothetical protein